MGPGGSGSRFLPGAWANCHGIMTQIAEACRVSSVLLGGVGEVLGEAGMGLAELTVLLKEPQRSKVWDSIERI